VPDFWYRVASSRSPHVMVDACVRVFSSASSPRLCRPFVMHFCPTCANILLVSNSGPGGFRFFCQTCPYIHAIKKPIAQRMYLKRKEVDDVLGGADAWKNVDQTEGQQTPQTHRRAWSTSHRGASCRLYSRTASAPSIRPVADRIDLTRREECARLCGCVGRLALHQAASTAAGRDATALNLASSAVRRFKILTCVRSCRALVSFSSPVSEVRA
jgi:DNA-directed RNA polymerase III subunit RPC11